MRRLPVTVDVETFGIEGRPHYPPQPVGVAIKYPGKRAEYYAFGHATANNCGWGTAAKALRKAYRHRGGVLFQNAKFDLDVIEVWFGLAVPNWQRVHDTMFLLFLDDPHQRELGLKEAAARLLNWPAEERDAVGEWLLEHQPVPGVRISKSKNSPHYFGRYLAYAPGDLVGKYAAGDVERTEALFELLHKKTIDRGMSEAYDRERRLLPVLLEMERQGLPVDLPRLRADVEMYAQWHRRIDAWLRRRLNCGDDVNLNSGAQLFDAMLRAGVIDESKALRTKTGKFQTNKDALLRAVSDRQLLAVLAYRAQLSTCLGTFMEPWLRVAEASGGLIYTQWNQVRSPKGKDNVGTRTGRLSSTPNFQNIPNEFEPLFKHEVTDRVKRKTLPRCPFNGLPPLPLVRSYIVPWDGHVFIDRDYSQQEPRILAHFDGGALQQKYIENPWIDFHDSAQEELAKRGKYYPRKPVKNTNLGLIYGMGVGKLAEKNNMSVEESKALKSAILQLYPGLREMYSDMKQRAALNLPIRTWGGREYYCEPPKLVGGKLRKFDYKLVNVLIQGSAADCTKEALIRFFDVKRPSWRLALNVHDQITVSVPREDTQVAMEALREAMESVEFDVPMLSEGSVSTTNWAELIPYDKKGELCAEYHKLVV